MFVFEERKILDWRIEDVRMSFSRKILEIDWNLGLLPIFSAQLLIKTNI